MRLACLAIAALCAGNLWAGLDRSRLNIGVYYLNHNAGTEAYVRDLAECGVDFVFGPAVPYAYFRKYGLGHVSSFVMTHMPKAKDTDRMPEVLRLCDEDARKFRRSPRGSEPSVWGISVGDEPSAKDFPNLGKAVAHVKALFPDKFIYLNLFPNYASVAKNTDAEAKSQLGVESYQKYIDEYCREIPLDFISWDFYLYSGRGDSHLPLFYDNFRIVADACRKTSRDMWFIGQVNSIRPELWISENMLRFQAFAAMSFGAQNISWACYSPGWWTNSVLTAKGEKTRQYERLKTVNLEIRRIAPDYMRWRNIATHFIGFTAGEHALKTMPMVVPRNTFDNGQFRELHATDGGRLVVGEMVPRTDVKQGGGVSAVFVFAADDPYDVAPKPREVRFRLSEGMRPSVIGVNGVQTVYRTKDGVWSFPIASSCGALVVASQEGGGR